MHRNRRDPQPEGEEEDEEEEIVLVEVCQLINDALIRTYVLPVTFLLIS